MKTRELIDQLQRADPSGELEVIADGTPVYFVSRQDAYYDGPLEMLIHDDSKRPYYSIVGYKVTQRGQKVRLHLMGLSDVLLDEPEAPVDLSELSDWSRERWANRVAGVRDFMRELKCDTRKWAEGVAVRAPTEAAAREEGSR
jgi:hypothetical protein